MKFRSRLLVFILGVVIQASYAQKNEEPFTIENYYKVKWGYADEFLDLYRRNHYPLLKKALEKGDILSITLEKPRQHAPEESRWDYRVTLVFKNIRRLLIPT